jgi:HlyD family secretion protein
MKTDFLKRKKKALIIIPILIVVVIGAVVLISGFGRSNVTANKDTVYNVSKGNIKVEISGSGVIEPIERYDITALVNGNITDSPFEEGQQVKKGDILYRIDATEMEGNIQKAKNNISRLELNDKSTRESLSKTVVYAESTGVLTNFNVRVNDTVGGNKLGDIVDNSRYIARVPFNKAQIAKISIGEPAKVASEEYMTEINGTVSKISSLSTAQENGVIFYDVEILIPDTDTMAKGTKVSASIGNMVSSGKGTIDAPDPVSVSSELSGKVVKVYASNNDNVVKGQKLIELDNETYLNTLSKSSLDMSDAKLSLEAQQKQLEDYYIKSPISGIVLTKNSKAGDTINAGLNAQPLMVVVDFSKVKFNMKIDELDIAKIKIGQKVSVVADALPESAFIGKVTSIAGEGTGVNGVSSYDVQVTIDNPGMLKPGMNVSAKTIVAEKENVLLVPASVVQKKDGKSFVLIPADDNGNQKVTDVQIGLNNKNYVEITNGLKEGDAVIVPALASEDTQKAGVVGAGFGGGGGAGNGGGNSRSAFPK